MTTQPTVEVKVPRTQDGSGHEPFDEKKFTSWLGGGDFDGMFQNASMPSAIEKFVDLGERVEDLFLRADFRDTAHAMATVRLLRKAIHFHDNELKEMILNATAAHPAIRGKRIDILKECVIGQLKQEEKKSAGSRMRSLIMGDKGTNNNGNG